MDKEGVEGKVMEEITVNNKTSVTAEVGLPAGIYIIQLKGSRYMTAKKVIIQ